MQRKEQIDEELKIGQLLIQQLGWKKARISSIAEDPPDLKIFYDNKNYGIEVMRCVDSNLMSAAAVESKFLKNIWHALRPPKNMVAKASFRRQQSGLSSQQPTGTAWFKIQTDLATLIQTEINSAAISIETPQIRLQFDVPKSSPIFALISGGSITLQNELDARAYYQLRQTIYPTVDPPPFEDWWLKQWSIDPSPMVILEMPPTDFAQQLDKKGRALTRWSESYDQRWLVVAVMLTGTPHLADLYQPTHTDLRTWSSSAQSYGFDALHFVSDFSFP